MPSEPTDQTHRLEITSMADRHVMEALQLEIRRLAREHGLEVTEVRITEADEPKRGPAR